MAASSKQQVQTQIKNFQLLAKKIAAVQTLIYQVIENEEVVSQNWNQLHEDFPELFQRVEIPDTDPVEYEPLTNNSLLAAGVTKQPVTARELNQFDNAIQQLRDALDGVEVTITRNIGRDIRRLTDGVV